MKIDGYDVMKPNEIVVGMIQGVCKRHDLDPKPSLLGVVIFAANARHLGIVQLIDATVQTYGPPPNETRLDYDLNDPDCFSKVESKIEDWLVTLGLSMLENPSGCWHIVP